MSIVGPAIGATLIASGGTTLAFAINCASFAVSAGCIVALLRTAPASVIPTPSPAARQRPNLLPTLIYDFRAGLAATTTRPWVWITIVLAGIANVIPEGATEVTIPFLVQQTLHGSALLYGGLTAATALGAILAAVWLGRRRLHHRGWLIYGFYLVAVLMLTVIGRWPLPVVMLAAMAIFGLSDTALALAWMHALQEYIPGEQLGRVSSLDQLGSYLLSPLSYLLMGSLTDHWGAGPTLIWGGLAAAAIFAAGLLSRSVRQLD